MPSIRRHQQVVAAFVPRLQRLMQLNEQMFVAAMEMVQHIQICIEGCARLAQQLAGARQRALCAHWRSGHYRATAHLVSSVEFYAKYPMQKGT